MDVHRFCFIVIYCVIILQETAAKTFSLNEAIAAETQQKQPLETALTETKAERFSLNKILTPNLPLSKKIKKTEIPFIRNKKLSPLKFRKTFQIKTPLKPKKLKRTPKLMYKGKNQSIKREINGYDKLNQKYIPLLKSISMLFDNLLDTESSSSYETTAYTRKRNRNKSELPEEGNSVVCKCADKSDVQSSEKTVAVPNFRTAISTGSEDIASVETSTTTTDNTPISDVSRFRQHKNVPLLLTGNPISSRRNNNGFSERSGTTYNRSVERNLTRDYGNCEYITQFGENGSYSQCNEEVTDGPSRERASGNGLDREYGNEGYNSSANISSPTNESIDKEENSTEDSRFTIKFKREDNLEAGRNKTKSSKLLSKPIRRLRGYVTTANKVDENTEPKHSQEAYTENVFSISNDNASYKRIINRSSPITTENQEIRTRNETITSNFTNKAPVVMIIDGYSVTRNKYGENKLAKKSIHFQP